MSLTGQRLKRGRPPSTPAASLPQEARITIGGAVVSLLRCGAPVRSLWWSVWSGNCLGRVGSTGRPYWLHRVGSAGQVVTWAGHFAEYGPTVSKECSAVLVASRWFGRSGCYLVWNFVEYGPTVSEECATSFEMYGRPCVGQVAPARYVPQTNPFVLLLAGIPQQIKRQEKTLSCLTQTGKGFS